MFLCEIGFKLHESCFEIAVFCPDFLKNRHEKQRIADGYFNERSINFPEILQLRVVFGRVAVLAGTQERLVRGSTSSP